MTTKRKTPINEVLARNIAEAMRKRHVETQAQLARISGLAQRTISNYLHPNNRQRGSSGKPPSAKLSEVEQIAKALDIETWDLLRDQSPKERAFYERIAEAYRRMVGDDDDPTTESQP